MDAFRTVPSSRSPCATPPAFSTEEALSRAQPVPFRESTHDCGTPLHSIRFVSFRFGVSFSLCVSSSVSLAHRRLVLGGETPRPLLAGQSVLLPILLDEPLALSPPASHPKGLGKQEREGLVLGKLAEHPFPPRLLLGRVVFLPRKARSREYFLSLVVVQIELARRAVLGAPLLLLPPIAGSVLEFFQGDFRALVVFPIEGNGCPDPRGGTLSPHRHVVLADGDGSEPDTGAAGAGAVGPEAFGRRAGRGGAIHGCCCWCCRWCCFQPTQQGYS
mmetsp:Transcript_25319/g.56646  ORF Transcript_25319/g.56646 Transcript_25319/m.56646 type:complete len:274 (-) Transcript_25319:7-828(-)